MGVWAQFGSLAMFEWPNSRLPIVSWSDMIMLFLLALLLGFGGMVLASQRAVGAATELVAGTRIPPFFVGISLLAVGTDLPEIANSIAASVTGHGDVNVGDSVGSAATQFTLVLGLLPIIAGALTVPKDGIVYVGAFTAIALGGVALLLSDGDVDRLDAVVLLTIWVAGSWVIYKRTSHTQPPVTTEVMTPRVRLALRTFVALAVVAGSAVVALWAIVGIAEKLDAPEFLISFFLASVGTSLPELAFDLTALQRGATAMAIGDVMGSSFVDATLSISAGPLLAPTDVTSDLVVTASLSALVAVVVVTVIMSRVERHDWRTGTIFLGLYAGFFVMLL